MRPSYLYNGNSYVRKMVSWWSPQPPLNKWSYPEYTYCIFGYDLLVSLPSRHMSIMASRITRNWMFLQQFIQVCSKNTPKSSHHWPFVRAIHRWPVDSPHKGWVMRKAFPCPDVFMLCLVKYVFLVFRRIWSMLPYITNVHTDVTPSLSSHQDYTLLHCDYQASCAYVVAVDNKKTNYIYK